MGTRPCVRPCHCLLTAHARRHLLRLPCLNCAPRCSVCAHRYRSDVVARCPLLQTPAGCVQDILRLPYRRSRPVASPTLRILRRDAPSRLSRHRPLSTNTAVTLRSCARHWSVGLACLLPISIPPAARPIEYTFSNLARNPGWSLIRTLPRLTMERVAFHRPSSCC